MPEFTDPQFCLLFFEFLHIDSRRSDQDIYERITQIDMCYSLSLVDTLKINPLAHGNGTGH
jgi:hypothetical protein